MGSLFGKLFKNFVSKKKQTNMEKEIFEQPEIINKLIKKYINKNGSVNVDLPENIKKVILIASGSSYHSAAIAASYYRDNIHCEAQAYYSSEFSLLEDVCVDNDALYVFISQSGETSDTNKALNLIKEKTDNTLSITNTKNSTLYNNTKYKILVHAGVENAIASTKALSAQIFCLFLVAIKIKQQRNISVSSLLEQLNLIPFIIENTFQHHNDIKDFAKKLSKYDCAAILASGMFYSLALEGALKIKETSYVNTTAYPTGEFLHGHIAVLNKKCAVISLVNNTNVDFTIKVLEKISDEYVTDSLVITAFQPKIKKTENCICINSYKDVEFLFASLVVFQLLAFETATQLGRDIDSPIGLTKVVK